MAAKRKKKKIYKPKSKKVLKDRIAREEVLVSVIWIVVLIMIGLLLSGTRYATFVLVLILIGLIGSLIVINYNK